VNPPSFPTFPPRTEPKTVLTLRDSGTINRMGVNLARTGLMQLNLAHRRGRPAFTLIEIMIVAALISVLSAIALISVRTFMERSRLRVVVGETYQIFEALSFARDDIGFYPKLNFLLDGVNQIGVNIGAINAGNPINPDFEYFGNDISGIASRIVPSQAVTGSQGWKGPYIGMSAARRGHGLAGGPTIVTMELPVSGQRVDFPADAWNQPYALYIMNIDANGEFSFAAGPQEFGRVANFFNAVVSYGPNRVPGGETVPPTSGLPNDLAGREPARLYTTIDTRSYIYGALRHQDWLPGGANLLLRTSAYFAIVDPASDDLIKQF
jgi:prepilin-type N-terminal cleavage/methylation domain-containing protein